MITPLILAAKMGYMNGVRLLIEHARIDILLECGAYGENALHAAVQSGSDDMAAYILRVSQNALLEKSDNNGTYSNHLQKLS
jgi:ankyrin repeat protein